MIQARLRYFSFLVAAAFVLLSGNAARDQTPPVEGRFRTQSDKAGITSLKFAGDKFDTDYIADEATLGHVRIRCKMGENEWRDFSTEDSKNKVQQLPAARSRKALQQLSVVYNPQSWQKNEYYADPELTERFRVESGALYWTIFVRNPTHEPMVNVVRRASAKQN